MYLIRPYHSINDIPLDSTPKAVEDILGKTKLTESEYNSSYSRAYYDGIEIEYFENRSSFIGVLTSLNPVHDYFKFGGKSYQEILSYFKLFPGSIYQEGKTALYSEHLGISTYFEDGLKQVGIFSKNSKYAYLSGLDKVT